MKVCIDGVAFQNSHQRGVQRYHRELIERYPASVRAELLLTDRIRCQSPSRGVTTFVLPAPIRRIPSKWRRSLTGPVSRRLRARRERDADIFHSTYFTRPVTRMPTVITVYDMIVERYTEFSGSKWADREVRRKREAILGADALITISKTTGDELAAFYPETAGRIIPIHLGADHLPRASSASPGRETFCLYVGDRGGYKNFRILLEAMSDPAWPRALTLTVVGSAPNESEALLVNRLAAGRVSFVGRVDEDALGILYAQAAATIVPSLAEGFGLPIVEAQRAGSPVVCSDVPVFREIAADSAEFFDPARPADVVRAVQSVLDPTRRTELRERGAANSDRFTWDRCVQETVAAYQRAIDGFTTRARA